MPNRNTTTPTYTMPLRLASFALNSRAVSFCAAPSSLLARVSSCSVTGIGALINNDWALVMGAPPASETTRVRMGNYQWRVIWMRSES